VRFRYLKDPLFLFCVAVYFVNREIVKPYFPNTFSRCFLNDLICLPFWVPIMLLLMRALRLRSSDGPPTASELLVPLILWSVIFEVVLPRAPVFSKLETADHVDILCYAAGGLVAAGFWKLWYSRRPAMRAG